MDENPENPFGLQSLWDHSLLLGSSSGCNFCNLSLVGKCTQLLCNLSFVGDPELLAQLREKFLLWDHTRVENTAGFFYFLFLIFFKIPSLSWEKEKVKLNFVPTQH